MKRGIDQLSAWLLAVALAGTSYGVVYGIIKLTAKSGGEHESADDNHGSHGGKEAEQHGSAGEHGDKHGDEHGDKHAKPAHSADDHAGEHDEKPKSSHEGGHKSKAKINSEDDHSEPQHDDKHGKGHDDAAHDPASKTPGKELALAAEPWGYRGSIGPDHWGELSSSYVLCRSGKKQSPVDIAQTTAGGKLLPIRWRYERSAAYLSQQGDRLSLTLTDRGSSIDVEGERYDFVRLDLHAPSEHKVSGLPYDLELSLVHKDNGGQLVIVNVLVEEGAANAFLEGLVARLPVPDKGIDLKSIDLTQLLPKKRTYYRYDGSLTTPPCSEGVIQLVMTRSIEATARQIDALAGAIGFNARPVQALNGRRVLKSTR